MPRDLERLRRLDAQVVAASRGIRLLSTLAWPKQAEEDFLASWRAGEPKLPEVETPTVDFSENQRALRDAAKELDAEDPVESLLAATARSYVLACRMLEAAGTPEFTRLSSRLFGVPGRVIPGTTTTSVQAARHFVSVAETFPPSLQVDDDVGSMSAEEVREVLIREIPRVITDHEVAVLVDDALAAKAAAGATRVRLRSGASFSEYDAPQLLQHEVFVHSLTKLNGQGQPNLTVLGTSSPRTTTAQEGLATFAELVTGTIDVARLRRIALRVVALEAALDGADFLQVFQVFLDAGQTPRESYRSAQRLFRGGDVGGGACFTKDGVYMEGLLSVYAFFQWCLRHGRLDLAEVFLAGRMTIADVFMLDRLEEPDLVAPPQYKPPWYKQVFSLAGTLAFAAFAHRFDLEKLECPEAPRLFQRAPLTDSVASFEAPPPKGS
jgi:uncharacterized protein (TIGR02421 family)